LIVDIQRRIREVGRIRMGSQVPANTKTGYRPSKLDTFRLTSPDRAVIDAVAAIYGGTVKEWDNNGATQYEVFTTSPMLRIALPPNPSDLGWSQFYEQWAKGYCSRRCSGVHDEIREAPCDCDPDNRTCKPTSRLSVLLPDVAGLGVWRLETHGWNAAVELAGAIHLIEALAGAAAIVPARLRIDARQQKVIVKGKPEVRDFIVPVIDLDVSIAGVQSLAAGPTNPVAISEGGWQPVPALEAPVGLSVESQLAALDAPKPPAKKRANAAAPLPATGTAPRKAAEVDAQVCSNCGKPYGAESLKKNPVPGKSRFIHVTCPGTKPLEAVAEEASVSAAQTPPPVTGRPMSANQHAKVMAVTAKVFPAGERKGPEADSWRRRNTLTLCEMLGIPGLTSRSQLNNAQASALIDALVKIEAGEWRWSMDEDDVCHLIENEDGEPLGSEPLREDDR
jgi:hypothetical protein